VLRLKYVGQSGVPAASPTMTRDRTID
jgi:hypothetical protein